MQTFSADTVSATTGRSYPTPRWTVEAVLALYEMPLMDLVWRAQTVHRQHFDPNAIQRSALLSLKTEGCSEDCGYSAIVPNRPGTRRVPSASA